MKPTLYSIATAILSAALLTSTPSLQAQDATTPTPKPATRHKVHRPVKPAKPSVEKQIQTLREDMQQQIQALQQQLSTSQSQLQAAQAAAAAAQAAAQQAQQQAAQQAQTLTENTSAVTSLQGAVTDLKSTSSSIQSTQATITEQQGKVMKEVEHPDSIHYKGVTLSATGSFVAAESVYRTRATSSDIPTPFTSVPLENTDAAHLSEFYGTARQSRLAFGAEGKLDNATLRGYYEMDWLGTGVTSNNNQSNSYVMRLRQIWGQASFKSGLELEAGQMWSMATRYKTGLQLRTEQSPQTIDPNYNAGFVWERQYGARIVQNFGTKAAVGISIENPQTLAPSGSGLPTNYLLGSAGTGGGLYNSAGAPGATSSANLANYSWNLAPDIIVKAAADPGFGHYEVFGIARFFRDRVYPGNTTTTTTTGGVTTTTVTYNSIGAYNDSTVGGGIGGSFQLPIMQKYSIGASGLWGDGVGRYGASQIGDITLRPTGQIAPLHGVSAMVNADLQVTPRLEIYLNYGEDEDFRHYFFTNAADTKAEGYGNPLATQTGCFTEPAPGSTPTAGFTPGSQSNCTANTRAVVEGTAGYWYDFYKGDKGRFRQGIQYSYIDKLTWSGVTTTTGRAPMGNDNVIETSFRYYLP
jgi:Skp family chaperone for outer membrane proteins